ncbi:MAG: heavy metal translocating P-type ATPase, partial [Bacteroidota bacterium]
MEKSNRRSNIKKPGTVTRKIDDDKKEKPVEKPVSKDIRPEKRKEESTYKDKAPEVGKHEHSADEAGHEHGGILGKNTELIFAILCGAALGTGYGLSYINTMPDWVSLSLYIIAYFLGGYFTAKEAVQTILKGGFEIDFLML